jgi:hypothetical protein
MMLFEQVLARHQPFRTLRHDSALAILGVFPVSSTFRLSTDMSQVKSNAMLQRLSTPVDPQYISIVDCLVIRGDLA